MKPDETQNRMQSEMTNEAGTLLEIRNLKVRFTARKKVLTAVDGVSMSIRPGEIVGVVGESGSGKSVMSQSILRLREYDSDVRYEGQVLFEGQDLLKASQAEMRGIRGNRIAVIFQDPMTSLSPVHTVGRQLSEVLVLHKKMTKQRAKERCRELLRLTGIPNPEDCMRKYPYELSGGMQQRVMIAMALSCNPSLLIADEPTTALDVTIQAQIMDLILELKEEMGMAVLLITHDMGLVAQMADRVLVMYAGQLIEQARVLELFDHPAHPYTRALLRSVPGIRDEEDRRLESIEGIVPEHYDRIRGCRFARRCPFRTEICMKPQQEMSVGDSHIVRCCRAKEVLADG